MSGSFLRKPLDVGNRSELRMHGGVSALVRADCPRTAYVTFLRGDLVVLSLAMRRADRMNGRQIEHVKTHLRDSRQLSFDVGERSVDSLFRRCGPWKQLIPGTERCLLAIDFD